VQSAALACTLARHVEKYACMAVLVALEASEEHKIVAKKIPTLSDSIRPSESILNSALEGNMLPVMPLPGGVLQNASFPTVLVAELDDKLRTRFVAGLRRRGFIVLEALCDSEALERIKIHSRHIHLMLVNGNANGRMLAATLKPYRPDMEVIFVRENEREAAPDLLSPDLVLDRVEGMIQTLAASR
jgi:hypothetical protein